MSFDHPPSFMLQATRKGAELVLNGTGDVLRVQDDGAGRLSLSAPQHSGLDGALAAFEALSNQGDEVVILLDPQDWAALAPDLLTRGIAVPWQGQLAVFPALFWQVPDRWLKHAAPAYPTLWRAGPHGRHPLRAPKPEGLLYQRHIPWLDQVFSLRALAAEDLPLFHRWMNDPRVNTFFEEAGTLDQHRAYIARMAADPHMLPVIGALDSRAFAYFELYWARENRIGAVYDAGAWDRGWHVLVGEEDARGADYITAWLPSLMHYMFLAEPRTQSVMGEPRASHVQQLRNLGRGGFARLRDFDFAHKRAALVQLERQHFFEARLWARPPETEGAPLRLSPATLLSQGAQ